MSIKYNIKNNLNKLLFGASVIGASMFGGTSCENPGKLIIPDDTTTITPPVVGRDVHINFSSDTAMYIGFDYPEAKQYLQSIKDSAAKSDVRNVYIKPVGNHDFVPDDLWSIVIDEMSDVYNVSNKIKSSDDTLRISIDNISIENERKLNDAPLYFITKDYRNRTR